MHRAMGPCFRRGAGVESLFSFTVIPAKAGIQGVWLSVLSPWMPACAGMTKSKIPHPCFRRGVLRRHDGRPETRIPAHAGIHAVHPHALSYGPLLSQGRGGGGRPAGEEEGARGRGECGGGTTLPKTSSRNLRSKYPGARNR